MASFSIDAAAVDGGRHRDLEPRDGDRAADPHPLDVLQPLAAASHSDSSWIATTGAPVARATLTTSPEWSEWPCDSRITSALSIRAPGGHIGLPSSHGSVTMRLPPGVVMTKVECPNQVIAEGSHRGKYN